MIKNIIKTKEEKQHTVLLYRYVFNSRLPTLAVFVLLTSFCLQPIERAYGAETKDTQTNTTVPVPVTTPVLSESDFPTTTTTTIIPTESTSSVLETVTNNDPKATSTVDIKDTSTSSEMTATNTTDISSTINVANSLPIKDSPPIVGTSSASSSGQIGTSTEKNPDKNLPPEKIVEKSSSTTEVEATTTPPVNQYFASNIQSDSQIEFKKDDCVTVADGSFYCQVKSKVQKDTTSDGFYSLPSNNGNLEIYLKKDGQLNQLTHDQADNSAPYFDAKSNSLVWQKQVDDRFQIISYDLNKNEEVQLTTGSENNMEPTRNGNYTVWQRWNKNNWDIVLYDGKEVRFLSTDPDQDIAPKIKGNYVMWNRLLPGGGQTIELYDILTDEYTTIDDRDGGSLSNPRMVLVYESEFANGDKITKGYDMFTGKIEPLSAKPADLPNKIPTPDKPGEIKALIQTKNTNKEEQEAINNLTPKSSGSGNNIESNGTTTLNMSTSTATSTGNAVPEPDLPINVSEHDQSQFDLVIPNFDSATTSTSTSLNLSTTTATVATTTNGITTDKKTVF